MAASSRPPKAPKRSDLYILRVELAEISPPIWRALMVPGDTTLAALHLAIQAAMPWSDSHLHLFSVGSETYSDPSFELEYAKGDEKKITVVNVAPRVGSKITYEYDFGDSWRHEITVKDIQPAAASISRLGCLAGGRACPPDDCGGVGGYEELLFALSHPNHERHEELRDWLASYRAELARHDDRFKSPFDPESFDLAAADRAVARLNPRGGKPKSPGKDPRGKTAARPPKDSLGIINRSAVIVRPAQPYVDWTRSLPGGHVHATLESEPGVYLVPPFDSEGEGRVVLEEAFPLLFERELAAWNTDEALWPKDRTLAMFEAWFRVELHGMLEDVCEGEIVEDGA